jgi:uncharacterized protein
MLWHVKAIHEVSPGSMAFLKVIKPVPDLLLVGCGASSHPLPDPTMAMLRDLNIGLELLPTVRCHALLLSMCST